MPQTYDDLTRDQLIDVLRRRDRERKLGLVWERREIEADRALNSDFILLDYDSDLSLGGDERSNQVIEGDNFDALRLLRTTHRGAIRFIYIDPPYNSGKAVNDTFVYNDNYVDPKDDYRHSKWLELMYQRLRLARDLLTPDGLIFVSIDDGEMARLRLLMDIVFPGNFQACLVWQSDGNADNTAAFKIQHEYILVYSRDKREMLPPPVIDPNVDESDSKLFNDEKRNTVVKNSHKNPESKLILPAGFPATFERGTIPPRSGELWPNHDLPIVVADYKVHSQVEIYSGWQNRNLFMRFCDTGFAPVVDNSGQLTSFDIDRNGSIQSFKPRSSDQSHVISVIRNVGSVQKTKKDLRDIDVIFEYPKPVGLIKYLLRMVPGKDFIALDFFAGTGTTGEAVARLNLEDGGTRNWIMVSSTEATESNRTKNVCRDACAKRLKHFFQSEQQRIKAIRQEAYGFSYSRVRRVATGDLDRELSADIAWRWIQSLHRLAPRQYNENARVQIADLDDSTLIFVDRATPVALEEVGAFVDGRPTFIYSWTPGRFIDIAEGRAVELRQIPTCFSDRLVR